MTLHVSLSAMTSNCGDEVELPSAGVTCIVGGNNAGKSQTLRDIASLLVNQQAATVVLKRIALRKPAGLTPEEAEQFLEAHALRMPPQPGQHRTYTSLMSGGAGAQPSHVAQSLAEAPDTLGNAWHFFFRHLTTGSLASWSSHGIGHVGIPASGTPDSPLQQIFRNGALEEQLSQLSYEVFGEYLTLDRINMDVRFRVGKVDMDVPPMNRPTIDYANAVAALPTLESQGDGVKSFLGLATAVLVGRFQILLIDEPEAFLHPGQARTLGRWLSRQAARRQMQIVIATHDRDLVLGLLEGDEPSVTVVRVVRDGSANRLHAIPAKELNEAWADPVLRYSNILQGLFHRRVVVCESDSDCRFYGAVLDELANKNGQRAQADDVLLVPSGGKAGVATLARSLEKLDVETHAFVDFDTLNNKAIIQGIVEAVGGTWTPDIDADFLTFVRPIQNDKLWGQVKAQGLAAVPAGEPNVACQRLLRVLDSMRVHIVPSGEIESFDRTSSSHGPAWVSEALAKGLHKSSGAAHDYVANLLLS
jgi:ABC-type cobalamin/Fe3+-siderophores transport system ATPase subunit